MRLKNNILTYGMFIMLSIFAVATVSCSDDSKMIDDDRFLPQNDGDDNTPDGGDKGDETPPPDVLSLTAIQGEGFANLSWVNPDDTNAEKIRISYTPEIVGIRQPITIDASETSYRLLGLAEGQTYTVTVKTRTANRTDSEGITIDASTLQDQTPPAEVEEIDVLAGMDKAIISWTNPAMNDAETILITVGTEEPIEIPASISSYVITKKENDPSFNFMIQTVDMGGNISEGISMENVLPTDLLIDDRPQAGGIQVYKTTVIDGKRWLAENMRYLPEDALLSPVVGNSNELDGTDYNSYYYVVGFSDGGDFSALKSVSSAFETFETTGLIYNWFAAADIDPTTTNNVESVEAFVSGVVQGVCPKGWHVPSKAEANRYLEPKTNQQLKSELLWETPGTNETGFSLLPSGRRNYGSGKGKFDGDTYTYLWYKDVVIKSAYNWGFRPELAYIGNASNSRKFNQHYNPNVGVCVRCLQDD
ncbi:MAG: FISUMP domain-containing protein [Bacteroidales bacterium]